MTARITKVGPLLYGTDMVQYRRIEFRSREATWLKTDLCPTHRNWERWKNYLEVGVILDNLKLMADGVTIDADSVPKLLHRPPKQEELF